MVEKDRVYIHKENALKDGAVIYRMSRDQRVSDNWALLFAQELALKYQRPLAVVFTLAPSYPGANIRHFDFMLKGLRKVEQKLSSYRIPFFMLTDGSPSDALQSFITSNNVAIVVSDFDPLRLKRQWIADTNKIEEISHYEVDAHNIVPCRLASSKVEFGAYTIRPKINKLLPAFLTEFPQLQNHPFQMEWIAVEHSWEALDSSLSVDRSVGAVDWIKPGEEDAQEMLRQFLKTKLSRYNLQRNDPTLDAQSNLAPYLHFGQISAQRIALEVVKWAKDTEDSKAFLEELIVRRELSDNFCYYNSGYDTALGFPKWALEDITLHRDDPREYIYSIEELEYGKTHDPLWNAAQKEMITTGKMHGYMRMYWAKKIMEWTTDVEDAQKIAIYLNDKYSLDGRDPNGYTGIAWCIGGVHDRAWFPRPIFGKIRYMSYGGCKSKFNINAYLSKVNSEQQKNLFSASE